MIVVAEKRMEDEMETGIGGSCSQGKNGKNPKP